MGTVAASAILALTAVEPARMADLRPETAAAYERYVRETDKRVQSELADPARFLWFEAASIPEARRRNVAAAVGRGEVVLERLQTREAGEAIAIPNGLVHHWTGIVFVPGAHLADAVGLMQDYDRHDEVFAPTIARSRLLRRTGDTFVFTMRFVVDGLLSGVLQTDQEARFFSPAPDRTHSRIVATRIVEIEDAGTPAEREKPEGHDRGLLWRQTSYWRFLERDGGTYVQCEVISLSRRVPTGLGWLIGGAATAVPRDTLRFTLERVQEELRTSP